MEQLICSKRTIIVSGWDLCDLSKSTGHNASNEPALLEDALFEFANCELFLQEYVEIHAESKVEQLDFIDPH